MLGLSSKVQSVMTGKPWWLQRGAGGSHGHTALRSRERWVLGLTSLSPFTELRTPAHGRVLPRGTVGLPTSVIAVYDLPHGHVQRLAA